MILKAGPRRKAHFAHDPHADCSPESARHEIAKRLIAQVVNDWAAERGEAPRVVQRCHDCRLAVDQVLPLRIRRAEVEARVDDRWRVDVGLFDGEVCAAAVEIRATHAVDAEKAAGLSVKFAELDADAVIDDPLFWRPLPPVGWRRSGPWRCEACKLKAEQAVQERRREAREVEQLAQELNHPEVRAPYRVARTTCWRCRQWTPVYTWEGRPLWCKEAPPTPRPPTVRWVYSGTLRASYWGNVCGRCGSVQGDHFLFNEPTGPFFGQAESDDYGVASSASEISVLEAVRWITGGFGRRWER